MTDQPKGITLTGVHWFTPLADFARSQATLFVNGDGTETVTVLHENTRLILLVRSGATLSKNGLVADLIYRFFRTGDVPGWMFMDSNILKYTVERVEDGK